jgi:hypothetical protein
MINRFSPPTGRRRGPGSCSAGRPWMKAGDWPGCARMAPAWRPWSSTPVRAGSPPTAPRSPSSPRTCPPVPRGKPSRGSTPSTSLEGTALDRRRQRVPHRLGQRGGPLARASASLPPRPPSPRWCMQGQSTRQMAHVLALSPHTVQDHLRSNFARTGVRTRSQRSARSSWSTTCPMTQPRPLPMVTGWWWPGARGGRPRRLACARSRRGAGSRPAGRTAR